MAIGDVYELTHVQSDSNTAEEIMSKHYFEALTAGASALGLATEFQQEDGLMENINNLQSTRIINERVRVINLFNLADFWEDDLSGSGIHAGEMLPLFNAISFTKKVDTRAVRPGGNRISGISEDMSVGGLLTATGVPALLSAARIAMATTIMEDAVATYKPVVVKRVDYVIDEGEPTERPGKRLPTSSGEATLGRVTTVLVNTRVSHQVSRGNGR